MPTIIFFDYNKEKISQYQKVLGNINNTIFINCLLEDLFKKYNVDILVSPANSYGAMTGGIDRDIVKLFPVVEKNVLKKVNESVYSDSSSRKYIPVGKCKHVSLNNGKILLIAPTMQLPQNIVGTDNIELAFSAILEAIKHLDDCVIVACPCLGTGVGGMSGTESAMQILSAWKLKLTEGQ